MMKWDSCQDKKVWRLQTMDVSSLFCQSVIQKLLNKYALKYTCWATETEGKQSSLKKKGKQTVEILSKMLLSRVWLFVTLWTVSPPGSSLHGIHQARILEWVAISFSRGSAQPWDWTQVSCIAGRLLTERDIECGPLCCTVRPYCLSFLHIIAYVYSSQAPHPPHLLAPPSLCLWVCLRFIDKLICVVF